MVAIGCVVITCPAASQSQQQGFEEFNASKVLEDFNFGYAWSCDGTSMLKQPMTGVQRHSGNGDTISKVWN